MDGRGEADDTRRDENDGDDTMDASPPASAEAIQRANGVIKKAGTEGLPSRASYKAICRTNSIQGTLTRYPSVKVDISERKF